jgi:hypothetical protein
MLSWSVAVKAVWKTADEDEVATNTWTDMPDEIINIMPSVTRNQVWFVLYTDMLLSS